MAQIFVTIKVAQTWPSSKDLAARNAITDALNAAQIGKCTGAGGGMGEMDFSYQVVDESIARDSIVSTMQSIMPSAEYQISSSD